MKVLKDRSFGIAREGVIYILFFALCSIVFALIEYKFLAIISLLFTFFTMNFFRDPERIAPKTDHVVVSPADGKVVDISKAIDPFTGQKKSRISVFMNVFNVHVNRAPISGKIVEIKYIEGKYFNASLDKASEFNERNLIRLSTQNMDFTVVQIAGLIARRIVCWVKEGEEVHVGQRIGIIKFGSRVDLYLPEGYEIKVLKGQKVVAGQSIVAEKSGT